MVEELNNAKRACWVIPGAMCEGIIQGTFIEKFDECTSCEFHQKTKEEEGEKFIPTICKKDGLI